MRDPKIAALLAENERLRLALAEEVERFIKAFAPAQPAPATNQPGK